jgi:hypothetical protein
MDLASRGMNAAMILHKNRYKFEGLPAENM